MPKQRRLSQRQKGTDLAVPDAVGALAPTRERLLALAGFDEAEQAKILRAAVDAELAALNATSVQRAAWQGTFGDEREDTDHATRLRAAEQLKVMLGANPSRSHGSGAATRVQVLVVTEAPLVRAEVIDAEAAGKPA